MPYLVAGRSVGLDLVMGVLVDAVALGRLCSSFCCGWVDAGPVVTVAQEAGVTVDGPVGTVARADRLGVDGPEVTVARAEGALVDGPVGTVAGADTLGTDGPVVTVA